MQFKSKNKTNCCGHTLHTQWPAWANTGWFCKLLSLPTFFNRWTVLEGVFPPKTLKMPKWQTVSTLLDEVLKTPTFYIYIYILSLSFSHAWPLRPHQQEPLFSMLLERDRALSTTSAHQHFPSPQYPFCRSPRLPCHHSFPAGSLNGSQREKLSFPILSTKRWVSWDRFHTWKGKGGSCFKTLIASLHLCFKQKV